MPPPDRKGFEDLRAEQRSVQETKYITGTLDEYNDAIFSPERYIPNLEESRIGTTLSELFEAPIASIQDLLRALRNKKNGRIQWADMGGGSAFR